jgi:hypothetical protein
VGAAARLGEGAVEPLEDVEVLAAVDSVVDQAEFVETLGLPVAAAEEV